MHRRDFLRAAAAGIAGGIVQAADLSPLYSQVEKHHEDSVKRLQSWIRQPSIAAENRGMNEGCDLMGRLLRDVGFDPVTRVPSDGQPGVFATFDNGGAKTIGIYFMYDVKQ